MLKRTFGVCTEKAEKLARFTMKQANGFSHFRCYEKLHPRSETKAKAKAKQ